MVALRSLLFWGYLVFSMPVWWVGAVVLWVLVTPFDRRRRLLHRYSCLWGSHYMTVCPLWTLEVFGREHLGAAGPCVITPNHQSLGDVLVLFAIHRHFKWVSKRSVFAVPFLGWNMWMNDYVPLVRGDKQSIGRMMDHCARHLRSGSPVLMFPEGTRSPDGALAPFKHGAFTLAVRAGVPVVPVAVTGTRDALPKNDFWLRNRARIVVRILPPIYPAEVDDDVGVLSERTRAAIAAALESERPLVETAVPQPAAS